MKNSQSLLRTAFGGVLTLFLFTAQAQWNDITGITPGATGLSFVSETTGVVFGTDNASLYKTLDGGATWNPISLSGTGAGYIHDVSMFDANTIFISSDVGSLRTTDGGATWDVTAPPTAPFGNLTQIHFVSPTMGLAVGLDSTYMSLDASDSWNGISSVAIGFGGLYPSDKYFIDQDTGYFSGFDGTFAYQGALAQTFDGGLNWTLLVNSNAYTELYSIDFLTGKYGFATNGSWENKVMRTIDGGITWDSIFSITSSSDVFVAIDMITTTDGYTVTQGGDIYKTTDGQNFAPVHSSGAYLYDIQIIGNMAYVVGTNKILKKDISTGIDEDIEGINFQMYPNPASEAVTFIVDEPGTATLYDQTGRVIITERAQQPQTTWLLNGIAPGMYLLEITTERNRGVKPLVIR